ncbi:MAG TPA: glycosyltransferase family 4 protein [Pseudonocardiaceae bacterium]|jgi:glycosyltransferase involved in cell wall biosynthesis|nr:glycosyltransferase family 4 protein [Pseudonocardiaceae bacterium]
MSGRIGSVRVLMVGSDPAGRGGMCSVASALLRESARPGFPADIRYVPTHRNGSAAGRLAVWLSGSARVLALLAARRADVLHAHVSERGSVLRKGLLVLAAAALRVPVVLHCHGAEFLPFYSGLPRPLRSIVGWLFRRADRLAVLGRSWREDYVRLVGVDPKRVVVVGNPVSLPGSAPEPAADSAVMRVLFLGRFGARKGSTDVLTAIGALPAESRALVRLRMAGDGELARTRVLAEGLRDAGIDVEVSGWLSADERDVALAESDVFVLPSFDEGLPLALLEAMAWGLAPVVSPVGSIGEVVRDGENGLLVRPGDVAGLTAALHTLISEPDIRARLGKAARVAVEPFDVSRYADRLAAMWCRLAGR